MVDAGALRATIDADPGASASTDRPRRRRSRRSRAPGPGRSARSASARRRAGFAPPGDRGHTTRAMPTWRRSRRPIPARTLACASRPLADGVVAVDASVQGGLDGRRPRHRHLLRRAARRAPPRLRRALERRRPARRRGRELRRRGSVPGDRAAVHLGLRAAARLSPARRRHLLPGPVAAVDARHRRAGHQRRDERLPARQRPARRVVGGGGGADAWACASWPGRSRPPSCAASPRSSGASRRSRRRSTSGRGGSRQGRRRGEQHRDAEGGGRARLGRPDLHALPPVRRSRSRQASATRTERFHAAGLAVTTYFNPMVCTEYTRAYEEARQRGVLTRNALGEPYEYRYTGASQFFVGQVDFTHPDAFDFYGDLLDEAVGHGYDGWMEDFGEYTPLDAHGYDGSTGEAYHNKLRGRLSRRRARLRPRPRAAAAGALQPLRLDGRGAPQPDRLGRGPDHGLGLRRPRVRGQERAHDGPLRRQPVGLGHRRLLRAVRAADDARAARALARVRLRVGRDAHAGERLRAAAADARAQIFDPEHAAGLGALREAAHAALSVPRGGRSPSTTAAACR